jgi:hypothetical protein
MSATYIPIANSTLTSNAASVTFNNFSGYTDLILIANCRGSSDTDSDINLRFNADTGSNYSMTRMYGQTSTAGSDRASSATSINFGRQGGTVFAPNIIHIFNYSNSTAHKSILARSGHHSSDASAITLMNVGMYRNNDAITSITLIQTGAQDYKTGSTFSLYGIKAE